MKSIVVVIFITLVSFVQAQVLTPEMRKRIYKDNVMDYNPDLHIDSVMNHQQRKAVPYPPIRQANIMWEKRIWRDIEVGEKMNLPIYYPINDIGDRKSLFDLIVYAFQNELIQPFDNDRGGISGDDFRFPISIMECDTVNFSKSQEQVILDSVTQAVIGSKSVKSPYQNVEVIKFRVKEDWYFDNQRSQLFVRIMGIMPIVEYFDEESGRPLMKQTAWFYFPELRNVLVNWEVYNRGNRAHRMTFDDLFLKRYFSSHIVKEENVYDRAISQVMPDTYDQLLEGEKIKEEIFNFEHDLWSY